jgi:hypothetical protein
MRWVIAALALGLAACDGSTTAAPNADGTTAAADGYTLEIRATEDVQTYLVTAPDGRIAGSRAANGVSALLDADRAQSLAAEPPPEGEPQPEVMAMRWPGFEMSISGSDEDANGENGSVNISMGGEQRVEVRADEGGPGDADDTAYVRITGADETAARDFINDAEELSAETKTAMLGALGLQ